MPNVVSSKHPQLKPEKKGQDALNDHNWLKALKDKPV